MERARLSWHEAYTLALSESDPGKLPGRIQYAIAALERRYAEWGDNPGTPAELSAIRKAVVALRHKLLQSDAVSPVFAEGTSDSIKSGMATALRNVTNLFLVARS